LAHLSGISGILLAAGCGSDDIVDDYRETAAVIRGRLIAAAAIDPGTRVHVSAIKPGYVDPVTVDVAFDGTFDVRPSSFGVGTFDADLRLVAEGAAGGESFIRDTTLTSVRFWEDRDGRQPDTVALTWTITPP
jgi:hypothetical protein